MAVCGMGGAPAALPAFEADGIAEVMHFVELTSKDLDNLFTSMRGRRADQAGHQIGLMRTKNIRASALWARTRVQMQDLPVGGMTSPHPCCRSTRLSWRQWKLQKKRKE